MAALASSPDYRDGLLARRSQSAVRATSVHPPIHALAPANSRRKTVMPTVPRGSTRACRAFMKKAKNV